MIIIKSDEDIRGSAEADAVFEKLMADLKRYCADKKSEEACKAYAKKKRIVRKAG